MKRVFNIIGAAIAAIFIFPFIPFIALAILLDDGLPIFVKLNRISRGKVIKIYKFRTMIRNADRMKIWLKNSNERIEGPFFKIKNDPRLTKIGKILRKFRVDEFPQIINVLKGEMSLIGPRPHEPEEVEQYPKKFSELRFAKAGITGLSQVSGASSLNFYRELELDFYYLKNQSLRLDLKIIFKTVWIFFTDPTGV